MVKERTVILIMIISLIFSCKKSIKNSEVIIDKSNNDEFVKKLEKQMSFIKGKKISSLSKIVGDTINTSNKVFFLYNGFDCEVCIDIGYEIGKKIDSINNGKLVNIISSSSNVGRDQLKNNYKNFVFNDEKDLIRKELKFIYTPVFIILNNDSEVKDIFFPNYVRNKKEEETFIKKCIENSQKF
ncbi:hypothetical protein JL193_05800 [Polaribacter batillariae]|uniref:Thioredoxin-like fold domain-containing protein n=1 Tax=Polaribacter batillariae TaxID=2808900 RepID=A0ABX7SYI3_9FLAO|nr:hypothetical protein [Polaribacter batillariae]QTD38779.1 hypothetical protein JL193_05800 [Polaribacter batillariae]